MAGAERPTARRRRRRGDHRHDDRDAARRAAGRRPGRVRRVLLLRDQRPHPDDLRIQPRRRRGPDDVRLPRARASCPATPSRSSTPTGWASSSAIGVERGRAARPDLKIGVCGEHGGDPASIATFYEAGLDYVSCSPFRVPVARLAAAQAVLGRSGGRGGKKAPAKKGRIGKESSRRPRPRGAQEGRRQEVGEEGGQEAAASPAPQRAQAATKRRRVGEEDPAKAAASAAGADRRRRPARRPRYRPTVAIPDEEVAQVRAATDIVGLIGEHVALRQQGRRWVGLCPFHGEKTPSFSVNAEEGLYYCFGCQASGDAISFVRADRDARLRRRRPAPGRPGRGHPARDRRAGRGPPAAAPSCSRRWSRRSPGTTSVSFRRPTPARPASTCAPGATTARSSASSGWAGRPTTGTP